MPCMSSLRRGPWLVMVAAALVGCGGGSATADDPSPPTASASAAPADARLSKVQILTEVKRVAPFVRACGVIGVPGDPEVLKVDIRIDPDGGIAAAEVRPDSPASPALTRCTADRVKTMRYPAYGGEQMRVFMPFAVERAGRRAPPAGVPIAAPGQSQVIGECAPAGVVKAMPTDTIRACRAGWSGVRLDAHPPFSVGWRIDAAGRAEGVRFTAGAAPPDVAACVVEAIAGARFPAPSAGTCTVAVGYPLPVFVQTRSARQPAHIAPAP